RPRDEGTHPHVLFGWVDVVQETRRRLRDGVLRQVVVARAPAGCLDAIEELAQRHRPPPDALEVVGRIVAWPLPVPDLDPDFDLRQRSLEVRGVPARDRRPAVGDTRDDHRPPAREELTQEDSRRRTDDSRDAAWLGHDRAPDYRLRENARTPLSRQPRAAGPSPFPSFLHRIFDRAKIMNDAGCSS